MNYGKERTTAGRSLEEGRRKNNNGEEVNGFNVSFWKGHWMKGVEMVMGALLLVLPLVWLFHTRRTSSCMGAFLEESVAALGALLIVIACVGVVGILLHKTGLLWAHLCLLLLLSLLLLCFLLFTFETTRRPPPAAQQQANLSAYPAWFRHRVHNTKHWRHTVACMHRRHACSHPLSPPPHIHLSPIQFGCCKPPDSCNYGYVDGKSWSITSNQTGTSSDCVSWSNDPSLLCFNCISCKVGVTQETQSSWKKVRTLLLIVLIVLLTLYAICGCGLFKSEKPQAY
ncbi:hypothetical protein L7F22_026358 [Adiantum nelumboides]|nr:hypothetical protein [Adiantum nelumboides]